MKPKEMSFGLSLTVNLGNYQSLKVEATQTYEIEDPSNYGTEVREALPRIKAGLRRQLEELGDEKMQSSLQGLSKEIKEEWDKIPE